VTRRHIFYTLDAYKERVNGKQAVPFSERLHKQIACLRRTPIATIQSILASGLELSDFWEVAVFLSQREPNRSVERLRMNEAVDVIEGLLVDVGIARSNITNYRFLQKFMTQTSTVSSPKQPLRTAKNGNTARTAKSGLMTAVHSRDHHPISFE
jgi:hypothetical protein